MGCVSLLLQQERLRPLGEWKDCHFGDVRVAVPVGQAAVNSGGIAVWLQVQEGAEAEEDPH